LPVLALACCSLLTRTLSEWRPAEPPRSQLNAGSEADFWRPMRLTAREHHPGIGHTSIAERVEVDFVRACAVEYQLSQGVLQLAILLPVAERFTGFEVRPSGLVDAVHDFQIQGMKYTRSFERAHGNLPIAYQRASLSFNASVDRET